VTKVKPNINSVEVHPQLSNNRHPVDGALVGAGLLCRDSIGLLSLQILELARLTWNYVIYMSWKKFRVWKFLYTSFFLIFSSHSKRQGSGTWIVLVLLFEEGAGCSRLPTDSLLLLLHTPLRSPGSLSTLPLQRKWLIILGQHTERIKAYSFQKLHHLNAHHVCYKYRRNFSLDILIFHCHMRGTRSSLQKLSQGT